MRASVLFVLVSAASLMFSLSHALKPAEAKFMHSPELTGVELQQIEYCTRGLPCVAPLFRNDTVQELFLQITLAVDEDAAIAVAEGYCMSCTDPDGDIDAFFANNYNCSLFGPYIEEPLRALLNNMCFIDAATTSAVARMIWSIDRVHTASEVPFFCGECDTCGGADREVLLATLQLFMEARNGYNDMPVSPECGSRFEELFCMKDTATGAPCFWAIIQLREERIPEPFCDSSCASSVYSFIEDRASDTGLCELSYNTSLITTPPDTLLYPLSYILWNKYPGYMVQCADGKIVDLCATNEEGALCYPLHRDVLLDVVNNNGTILDRECAKDIFPAWEPMSTSVAGDTCPQSCNATIDGFVDAIGSCRDSLAEAYCMEDTLEACVGPPVVDAVPSGGAERRKEVSVAVNFLVALAFLATLGGENIIA